MSKIERSAPPGEAPGRAVPAPVAPARPRPRRRHDLRAALSSPSALRRAVVLREVLGPPVALRDPSIDRPT